MIKKLLLGLALSISLFGGSDNAKADVFVVKDLEADVFITYPDDWREQFTGGEAEKGLKLFIMSPQAKDYASCRLYTSQDDRFRMYPPIYNQRINSIVYDRKNLTERLADYTDVSLYKRSDEAGFGRYAAVYGEASYTKMIGLKPYEMKGMMFGSLVYDKNVFFHCESAAKNWPYWHSRFLSIAKTADFDLPFTIVPQGYYRDFLNDGHIRHSVDNQRTGTSVY